MKIRKWLPVVCVVALAGAAAAQNINTVAGGGNPVGLAATSWGAGGPAGAAIDSSGNLYVALVGINQVWVVNSSGVVTGVIGNGFPGYSGDGGPAAGARLSIPTSVAVDASGNIYIADAGNGAIRKVTRATGVISTYALQLVHPFGIALDSGGNLYIADFGACQIFKVTAATGKMTTVAGNGTSGYSGDGGLAVNAELASPSGVAVDASGNIYVADMANNRIRKFTVGGNIGTVAGNGTAGYSGDGGLAVNAELRNPAGVAVDASSNIYVTDSRNERIRKFTVGGNIATVAGNGATGYTGDGAAATSAQLNVPFGIAVDAGGNLYIADGINNALRKFKVGGNISTIVGNHTNGTGGDGRAATSAGLYSPGAVAVDSAGNIYIADFGDNLIRKVTASTGVIATFAGTGTQGYSGDGAAATSATLNGPKGVALDTSGNLYIADEYNNVIREVMAATGIISTVAGTGAAGYNGDGGLATKAQLNQPGSLAIGSKQGNIFITDPVDNVVREVTVSDGKISTVAGNGTVGYSGDGAAATSAALNAPTGVAVDGSGTIYIADSNNNVIRRVTQAKGLITTVAGTGKAGYSGDGAAATGAALNSPVAVAVDAGGANIYVADSNNNVIRKFTAGGNIGTIAGNTKYGFGGDGGLATSAELAIPQGVAVSSIGEVYIADPNNFRVRGLSPAPATHFTITPPTSSTYGTPITFTLTALNASGGTASGYAGTVHVNSSDPAATLPRDFTVTGGSAMFSVTPGAAGTMAVTATDTVTSSISGTALVTVQKALLTVTANSLSAAAGSAIPTLTATIQGFVNGDTASVVTGSPSLATTATTSSAPGSYPITASAGTLTAPNYSFTFAAGTLTLTSTAGPPLPAAPAAGFVNSASFKGGASSTGLVTPGGLYSVFGTNLGPAQPVIKGPPGLDGKLATTLGGVTVTFDGIPAPMYYSSAGQLNFQVPFEIAGVPSAQVIINFLGSASASITVPVAAEQPAFFTITPSGQDSIATNQDNTLNTVQNPAPRGTTVTFYGTGLGQLSYVFATSAGAPAPPLGYTGNYTCSLGTLVTNAASVVWAPGSVGLAQFNVSIPANAPIGGVPVSCTSPAGNSTQRGTLYID